jgi:hypothetical protein
MKATASSSPNREQRYQWIGATIAVSSRLGLFGFLVFASGLTAIVLSKAKARHGSARRICR